MKNSVFSRRALLSGVLFVAMLGSIAGCSGGGSSFRRDDDDNDSNATRANITFSNATSAANTTTIDLQGSQPQVNADTTGIHAGFSQEFDEYHILLLSKVGSISRTLRLEIDTDNPANPSSEEGTEGSIEEGDLDLFYTERNGAATSWAAISGSVTVTNITNDGYQLNLSNVQFRSTTSATDVFTLNGTVNLEKSAVTVEPDATYHSHQDGFITPAQDRTQAAISTHAPKESKKSTKFKW